MRSARNLTVEVGSLLLLGLAGCGSKPPGDAALEVPSSAAVDARGAGAAEVHSGAAPGRRPVPGKDGLGEGSVLRPGPDDRCPVCAMSPARLPRSAAAIELDDGATYYFCANGCMIRSWIHPEEWLEVEREHLHRPVVQEYFDGRPIDAREATWVAGSDVIGPMGPLFVPLASEQDAAVFEERHGGKHRFRLDEMDDARWTAITGKPALPND